MELTARRSKTLHGIQIKIWVRDKEAGIYIPGRGVEKTPLCWEAWGGVERALPSLYALANIELAGGDPEEGVRIPPKAFKDAVRASLKEGTAGMSIPDGAKWVPLP